jgi:protein-S-isoprenylcysteine O-methyltransferase Ste14
MLIAAIALFFLLAFVWPMVRLRAATGEWGLVSHRGADPCQRLVGALMSLWFAVVAGWALALVLVGPGPLGVGRSFPRLGGALVAAGLALVVAAQIQMGASWRIGIDERPTPLVTRGLYSLVRNPIFGGMLLALLGVLAVAPTVGAAVAWVAVAQLIAVQVRLEEQHLLALHGEIFAEYVARTGRFVPGIG